MPNLGQTNPVNVTIGDTIKFTTKNPNDTVVYSGKVVAICDAQGARVYSDIAATHQAMLAADPTMDSYDLLRYLIVECHDKVRRPFGFSTDGSKNWFFGNTVEVIDEGSEYRIRLYNVGASDAELAIRILREQGFTCKIMK